MIWHRFWFRLYMTLLQDCLDARTRARLLQKADFHNCWLVLNKGA